MIMAPSPNTQSGEESLKCVDTNHNVDKSNKDDEKQEYKWDIVWTNVIIQIVIHTIAAYGTYLTLAGRFHMWTVLWNVLMYCYSIIGVTGGPHRLWSHQSFKAKWPFRLFVAIGSTIAFQNSIYVWSRDHRVHHKFTETNADPHNAKRGFFFSHCGWLLVKKHPDVFTKGATVDCSDLLRDPIVYWQHKLYLPLVLVISLIIPIYIPTYWGETLGYSTIAAITRYVACLNGTWTVNSIAHMYGNQPYDKGIEPRENWMVCIFGMGEGYHNYHHVFPFDYRASEFSFILNPTTVLIDLGAKLGLVSDRKYMSKEQIMNRVNKKGDQTHGQFMHFNLY